MDRKSFKLRQEPIDQWSPKEKLALATLVKIHGTQNWNAISRFMKPFGEENRPSDWFHSKLSTLQYNDMLEKIESTRGTKRGERGDETSLELLIKKYTNERYDELDESITKHFNELKEVRKIIEKLEVGSPDEELIKTLLVEKKKKEQKEKEDAKKHEEWLAERKPKLLQILTSRSRSSTTVKQAIGSPKPETNEQQIQQNEKQPNEIECSEAPKLHSNSEIEIQNEDTSAETPTAATTDAESSGSSSVVNVPQILSPKKEVISSEDIVMVEAETPKNVPETTEIVEQNDVKEEPEQTNQKVPETITSPQHPPAQESTIVIETATNDEESRETNETVVDAEPMSTENVNKTENQNNQESVDNSNVLDSDEQRKDSKEDSSIIKVETNEICQKNEEESEQPQNPTSTDAQANADDIEDQIPSPATPVTTTNKVGRKKGKRVSNSLNNASSSSTIPSITTQNNVIQTRSSKSQNTSTSSSIVTKETSQIQTNNKEDNIKQHPSTTSRKQQRNLEEISIHSEESNESKSNLSELSYTPTTSRANEVKEVDVKWKKAALEILRTIQQHKHSSLLMTNQNSDKHGILKEMDLNTIKRRVENGQISTNNELKRDLLIMFNNQVMLDYHNSGSYNNENYKNLLEFSKEAFNLFAETTSSEAPKTKSRDKAPTESEKINRRKTRGSTTINDETIGSSLLKRSLKRS